MRRDRVRASALAAALAIVLALSVVGGLTHRAGATQPPAFGTLESGVGPDAFRVPSIATPPAEPTHQEERPEPSLLVHVRSGMAVKARPDAKARAIGVMPSSSKYYRVPLVAWVQDVSDNGRWGRVEIPYTWPRRTGWILLPGLSRESTWITVEVDLSRHRITVERRGHRAFSMRAATGAPSTPTPPGDYFVTDRVPFSVGSSYGSFAFGISGIQPRLPAGWTGGNQLAIHGTNSPGSIGQSVSAGCLRVSESSLHRLLPLLRLGTPVVIHR
ncbi:MAG TPA: L,D-transpeptidase [Actinomycetota bacterium]|jgi:lipoprotein-anchoring transpeptidase ErfK/SrfK|nr:L,D-transpeptidase [Actinomycetota bacterium]